MRLLEAHGLRPDTDLGQHFLLDENLADLAVREAGVGPEDVAYEVGAGLGVLTAALAREARAVHAVEIDRRLEPALAEVVARSRNVQVHWGDAMRLPVEGLDPPPTVMVANLPYAIATPAVIESLWRLPHVSRWCVMVQREVADRWLAEPGGRLYGAPSVLLRLAAEPTFRRAVGREVFVPRPRVELLAGRAAPHRARAVAGGAVAGACGLRLAAQDARQLPGRRGRRQGRRRRGPGAPRRCRPPRARSSSHRPRSRPWRRRSPGRADPGGAGQGQPPAPGRAAPGGRLPPAAVADGRPRRARATRSP